MEINKEKLEKDIQMVIDSVSEADHWSETRRFEIYKEGDIQVQIVVTNDEYEFTSGSIN